VFVWHVQKAPKGLKAGLTGRKTLVELPSGSTDEEGEEQRSTKAKKRKEARQRDAYTDKLQALIRDGWVRALGHHQRWLPARTHHV
jgi:hypothetical protein